MTYVTSPSPNFNYSNIQNPPSSYLNNQNPAPPKSRVAKANPPASKSKKHPVTIISERILKELYPGGEMDAVEVLPYSKNPNPLVRKGIIGSLEAWTQNEKLIYVQEKYKAKTNRHVLAYVLKHESIHILQFTKNPGVNFSYSDMLNAELEDYGATYDWTEGITAKYTMPKEQQAKDFFKIRELEKVKKVALNAVNFMKDVEYVKNQFFIDKDFSLLESKKKDLKGYNYLRKYINDTSSEDLCAQIAFILMDALPQIKKNKIYTVKSLYKQLPKNDPYYKSLGY